jgi:hypothetical protein
LQGAEIIPGDLKRVREIRNAVIVVGYKSPPDYGTDIAPLTYLILTLTCFLTDPPSRLRYFLDLAKTR